MKHDLVQTSSIQSAEPSTATHSEQEAPDSYGETYLYLEGLQERESVRFRKGQAKRSGNVSRALFNHF